MDARKTYRPSISFYNVNQMPMSPRIIFTVKPQDLHVLLKNSAMYLRNM